MRRLIALLAAFFALTPAADAAWVWPVSGEVITPYRNGTDPYATGQHRGIDIGAPVGTPVAAATSGEVRFAGTAGSSGLTISIRTGDGYDTSYLHLSSMAVRAGAHVSAGERIGAVGTTGVRSAQAPHLHFGVRDAGTRHDYHDPLAFLPPPPPPPPAPPPPPPAPAPAPATRPRTRPTAPGTGHSAPAGPAYTGPGGRPAHCTPASRAPARHPARPPARRPARPPTPGPAPAPARGPASAAARGAAPTSARPACRSGHDPRPPPAPSAGRRSSKSSSFATPPGRTASSGVAQPSRGAGRPQCPSRASGCHTGATRSGSGLGGCLCGTSGGRGSAWADRGRSPRYPARALALRTGRATPRPALNAARPAAPARVESMVDVVLRHHAHLLRQRRASSWARVYDDRR